MNESKRIENAGMRAFIIPLAGIITALSLILAVILVASYFGAFAAPEIIPAKGDPIFEEPDAPDVPSKDPEGLHEDPLCRITLAPGMNYLYYHGPASSAYSLLSCSVYLINSSSDTDMQSEGTAYINELSCSVYSGDKLIEKIKLSDPFELNMYASTMIKGESSVVNCDLLVFFVEWSDRDGKHGSQTLEVAPQVVELQPTDPHI